jgi:hypothetical protein
MRILNFDTFANEGFNDGDDRDAKAAYSENSGKVKITGSVNGKELKDATFTVLANKHGILKLVPDDKESPVPEIKGVNGEGLKKMINNKDLGDNASLEGVDTNGKTFKIKVFSMTKETAKPALPPLPKIVKPALPPLPKIDTSTAQEVQTDKGHEQILAAVATALKSGGKMMKLPGKEKGTYQIIITGVKV